MIPKETIDLIFETARVEEIVGDFVALKKRGVNYIGNCPFHNEKTPSFTVSPTKGIYKCFGCGKGGNSINFVMEIEHFNYPEALKFVAKKYNIEIEEEELTSEQLERSNEKDSLFIVSSFANDYFQDMLWNSDEGKAVGLSYFKERGFTEETIKKFELGYNPKAKDAFSKVAIKKAYDKEVLVSSGLSLINESSGQIVDRFKERTMFPIQSYSGRTLGFGGRAFNAKAKAKYLNSPETLIYHKSKVLYGLNFAKNAIGKEGLCYIVEGYTDVISMYQNGIENVVSASGTALGLEQIKLINRLAQNVVLLFDGDNAGIKATYKSINMILKEGMNVKIAAFPEGEDPDSFAKKLSTDDFKNFLTTEAIDFIDYKINISGLNSISDPTKITNIKRDIIESISCIPDSLNRSQYCKTYSKKLDISENVLLGEVAKARASTSSFEPISTRNTNPKPLSKGKEKLSSVGKLFKLEEEILRILINYGNDTFTSEEEDQESVANLIISDLDADNITFTYPDFHTLFEEIIIVIEERGNIDLQYLINHQNREVSQKAIDLISSKHSISNNWVERHKIYTGREDEKIRKTTEKAILSLKKGHVDMQIKDLQQQIKEGKIDTEGIKLLSHLTKIKTQIAKSLGRNVG
ncbi:DNA primase [Flavobacteriales bacterium]|jgi:DNA primase|nr:DNA primase [Flavobacteriales bacterium]MDC3305663.1 DNA primase [Flavobacteriales bacterium]MDC3395081.1 DNA primase [Flavobacteriales bacterium]MDG1348584.1 DNA primase [Flavobacteriales bacterium]|tara:strand:+ start:2273 stop:4180 length:1908 start_codon:yes stop_codon:yes gene_type:complete